MPLNPVVEARTNEGWTQRQLARIANVSEQTVLNAEKHRPIGPLSQAKLAKALGVARADLFPDEESAVSA